MITATLRIPCEIHLHNSGGDELYLEEAIIEYRIAFNSGEEAKEIVDKVNHALYYYDATIGLSRDLKDAIEGVLK
jgi:hypothetical protein